jgi:hypothetical protein
MIDHASGLLDAYALDAPKKILIKDNKIFIAGSEDLNDWLINSEVIINKKGYHQGWYKQALLMRSQIKLDNYEVVGHSKGAAIAAILCLIDKRCFKATCYNCPNYHIKSINDHRISAYNNVLDLVGYLPLGLKKAGSVSNYFTGILNHDFEKLIEKKKTSILAPQ